MTRGQANLRLGRNHDLAIDDLGLEVDELGLDVVDLAAGNAVADATSLQVIEGNFYQTGKLPDTGTAYLLSDYEWSSEAGNSGVAAPRS